MRLDIQGSAISRDPSVRRHIEQRSLFELARYGERVAVVRVHVTERPPSAAHRYHCGIAVTVRHPGGESGHVLARSEGDEVCRLIELVLARITSHVGGEIERAQAAEEARLAWRTLVPANTRSAS